MQRDMAKSARIWCHGDTMICQGPTTADTLVVVAHGTGTASDSDFLMAIAGRLADAGLAVVRFHFP